MTKLESFEDWAQKTLAECSGINEQETFNKAKTELELELAVKKVLRERYEERIIKLTRF